METATRLRAVIGEVFRYSIATGKAENDPTFTLRGALTTQTIKHRAAIIEPLPFGLLLRAIDSYEDHQRSLRPAIACPKFVRSGELRNAEWTEFDLDEGLWVIPAGRMKMRRPHRVPLAPQAVAILKSLQAFTARGTLLFLSVRSVERCMSENTINTALRRLGYGKDDRKGHVFRAAASSIVNESGKWNPDAIKAQLAHVETMQSAVLIRVRTFGRARQDDGFLGGKAGYNAA